MARGPGAGIRRARAAQAMAEPSGQQPDPPARGEPDRSKTVRHRGQHAPADGPHPARPIAGPAARRRVAAVRRPSPGGHQPPQPPRGRRPFPPTSRTADQQGTAARRNTLVPRQPSPGPREYERPADVPLRRSVPVAPRRVSPRVGAFPAPTLTKGRPTVRLAPEVRRWLSQPCSPCSPVSTPQPPTGRTPPRRTCRPSSWPTARQATPYRTRRTRTSQRRWRRREKSGWPMI